MNAAVKACAQTAKRRIFNEASITEAAADYSPTVRGGAGAGAVLSEDGKVELDAAIMCGDTIQAGAVTCVSSIATPIQLARAVVAESEHMMFIASGAQRFKYPVFSTDSGSSGSEQAVGIMHA